MAYFVYSSEPVPNTNLQNKYGFLPGYTPEYLQTGGITLPNIPEKQWMRLPDYFSTERRKSWADPKQIEQHPAARIVQRLQSQYEERGIVFLDHEPTDAERAVYEQKSRDANRAHRMKRIEEYEAQVREREVTGVGRKPTPTPYEDECYTLLGISKPYSVEAILAQRQPGVAVGAEIVAALERLEKRRAAEAVAAGGE